MKLPLQNFKKTIFVSLMLFLFLLFFSSNKAFAIENPLSSPNNKFGIHILFPDELDGAAKLVNSSGGDWGYVTIPIQANDRNLVKWQSFMDKAKTLHLIPIIRIATVGDYFNTKVWEKPTYDDVLDFANFLNSLNWPTKNRYVVIFNEPNRNDEWGGKADPSEYTQLLSYAADTFKRLSPDFFVISAGLDNGADTNSESINEYEFINDMGNTDSSVFNKIDGIASHSYPNPGFSQPPTVVSGKSIASFLYEKNLIKSLSYKELQVFITETGWSNNSLSPSTIASYYRNALSEVWANDSIVAITPFLLEAGVGTFTQFSFLDSGQKPSASYETIKNLPKIEGKPVLAEENTSSSSSKMAASLEDFNSKKEPPLVNFFTNLKTVKTIFKWFLSM